jgi:transcriptional regulator with XRE-family HTH domain
MNTFGERLRELLEIANFRPSQLAIKTGKAKQTVSSYLTDRTEPDLLFFEKLKEIIPEANLNWLITGKGGKLNDESAEIVKLKNRERDLTDALLKVIGGKTPVAKIKGVCESGNLFWQDGRLWMAAKHTVIHTPQFAH